MGQNETLLLLPGLLCDGRLWRDQIEAFSASRRVVVACLTGHDSIAAVAEAAIAGLDGPLAVAGLSMGGYVALESFAQAPRRITRLALLDTRATAESPEDRARRGQLVALVQRERGFAALTKQLLPLMVHASRLGDPALTGTIRDMAARVGVEAYARQQAAIVSRRDFRPGLRHVDVPTLVLCGREDQITPLAGSEEMAAAIPGARLVVPGQCGHMSTLESPDAVNAALRDWLGES